jgi:hypothetical protein
MNIEDTMVPSLYEPPSDASDCSNEVFAFTMRRVRGISWGIEVKHEVVHQALLVVEVLPRGAIEAWNRQVKDGPKADKALRIGDLIVEVNAKNDCQGMVDVSAQQLHECQDMVEKLDSSTLLTVKVLRMSAEVTENMIKESQGDGGWKF